MICAVRRILSKPLSSINRYLVAALHPFVCVFIPTLIHKSQVNHDYMF